MLQKGKTEVVLRMAKRGGSAGKEWDRENGENEKKRGKKERNKDKMRFVEREKKEDKEIKKYLFILYFYYLKN